MENIIRTIMYVSMGICCVALIWVVYIAVTSGLVINISAPGFSTLEVALLTLIVGVIPTCIVLDYFERG